MTAPERAPDANWIEMKAMAHRIREVGEMEHGIDPLDPDSDEMLMIDAGVALGIAAATEFYKNNPDQVPPRA